MTDDVAHGFPEQVKAIALDANCMPRGLLDLGKIATLVEIIEELERDIEVWVLEPVLWEWSEHLLDSIAQNIGPFTKTLAAAERAGLEIPSWPGIPDEATNIDSLVTALSTSLKETGAEIVRLSKHPNAAVQGIKDQILQTGSARRKTDTNTRPRGYSGSRVKTGAADSASFNLLEERAGSELRNIVLVSGDRDAAAHFSCRPSPYIVKDLFQLRKYMLSLTSGAELAASQFLERIYGELPEVDESTLRAIQTEDDGNVVKVSGWDLDRYLNTKVSVIRIDSVDDADNIEVSHSYASASVQATVSVEIEGVWWDGGFSRLENDYSPAWNVAATLEVFGENNLGEWELQVEKIYLHGVKGQQ